MIFEESLAEFAAKRSKENQTIFSGGVYVGENTSRAVSVRAQASARSGAKNSGKMRSIFPD